MGREQHDSKRLVGLVLLVIILFVITTRVAVGFKETNAPSVGIENHKTPAAQNGVFTA